MSSSISYSLDLYSTRASDVYRSNGGAGANDQPSPKLLISFNYRYKLNLPTREGVNVLLDDVETPEIRRGFKFPICPAAPTESFLRADFVKGSLKKVVGASDGSAEDAAAMEEMSKRILWFWADAERKYGSRDFVVVAAVGAVKTEEVSQAEVAAFVAAQKNAGAVCGNPIVN